MPNTNGTFWNTLKREYGHPVYSLYCELMGSLVFFNPGRKKRFCCHLIDIKDGNRAR